MTRQLPPPQPPIESSGKPISIWILLAFLIGGAVGGTFAALNGNWVDVGLAAILVVGALIGLYARFANRSESASKPTARRVVLVEDDEAVRTVGQMMVSDAGYEVDAFGSAEDALEAYAERAVAIGVLMTDLRLPGMPGDHLARALREKNPDIRVLFVTGYVDPNDEDIWRTESNVAFVQKPFRAETIRRALRDLVTA